MSDAADKTMPEKPWVDCMAHMHYDEDCEFCVAEMEQKQAVATGFSEKVLELDRKLVGMTGQSFLQTSPVVASLKTDVLVQMIFPDPKQRMAFELNYGHRLTDMMERVLQAQTRNLIMNPGVVRPTKRTGK